MSTAHGWWMALGAALGVARADAGRPAHLALAIAPGDPGDTARVLAAVRALEGVAVARLSHGEGRLDIGYDASVVSPERLLFAVHAIEPSARPWHRHPIPWEARGRDACC